MDNQVVEEKSWKLSDGRTVQYYKIGEWSFSNLTEEDFNYNMAVEAAEAWAAWAEFIKNNPELGAEPVEPVETTSEEKVSMRLDTGLAYRKGYEHGYSDSEKLNAPPF